MNPDQYSRVLAIAEAAGISVTEVLHRIVAHGLEHADLVFDWRPGMPPWGTAAPTSETSRTAA